MGTGFCKKKKQAKLMQNQLMQMQEQMKDVTATGVAGNGLLEIVINGDSEVLSVKIKPECVDPDDVEGLEDLIKSAFNNAQDKLKKDSSMNLKGLPQIPGLPSFGM